MIGIDVGGTSAKGIRLSPRSEIESKVRLRSTSPEPFRAPFSDGSSLVGSATSLAGAVTRLLDRGGPLADTQAAPSSTPTRTLRLADPALVSQAPADLVLLDGTAVVRVMKAGRWLA